MSQLLNKTPQSEKGILPNSKSAESTPRDKEFGREKGKEVPELDKLEMERLRQEVLEGVDELDPIAKKSSALPTKSLISNALRKSQNLLHIESILEKDLVDVFFKMEPHLREKFKQEGEKTAVKVEEILKSGKIEARKIFKLILKWLKVIPGVNKFFLKQEAKIKTDKLTNLH